MITAEQKKKLKEVLGNNYSQPILDYLNNQGIKNKYGLPFTSMSTIRSVMNGNRSNSEIEKAFFKVYEEKEKELQSEEEYRKRILESKIA